MHGGYQHFRADLACFSTVICRFDGELVCDRAEDGGRAGQQNPQQALTHVGQSSVEIGLMNRRERETAGLLVFQYPPSLSVGPVFICTTWGEKKMRGSVGGKSGPVKRISDNRS